MTITLERMTGVQTPRLSSFVDVTKKSSGQDAIELCAAYGLHLDPWQQLELINGLQEENNKWVHTTNALSVPRQQGKTAILEARALAGVLLFDEQFIVISSHEVRTTSEIFRRMRSYFEDNADLKALVKHIRLRAGEEAIELHTGQRIRFMARSRNAGRGFTADVLLMDEAQELSEDAWGALLPTITASAKSQVWMFGTPPTGQNSAEVFKKVRQEGLANAPGVYYAEWSADPSLDLDDKEGWAQANPALGIRVQEAQIATFRAAMSDDAFAREILGIWTGSASRSVIDADTWAELGLEIALNEDAPIYLSIDVAPDRSSTSVSLVQPTEHGLVAVLLDRRTTVTWAVDYVAAICGRRNVVGVAIDGQSAAGGLVEPLRSKQVPLMVLQTNDVKRACGRFYDLVMDGTVRHLSDPAINLAVAGARKRTLGEAWAWNRASANVDITPLVAITYAVWATEQKAPTTTKPKQRISTRVYGFN